MSGPSSNPYHSLCMLLDHRAAPINLENKALVGELCRFGGEICQFTAKKPKTRTTRARVPECQLTCKLARRTHMIADSMVNINNTTGRQVVMVLWVTHYMAEFVRILCTLKYRYNDNFMVGTHLTLTTACL